MPSLLLNTGQIISIVVNVLPCNEKDCRMISIFVKENHALTALGLWEEGAFVGFSSGERHAPSLTGQCEEETFLGFSFGESHAPLFN